jgi:ABC-type dipeptide/oligopeptide/nickel transport system permease subunit
MEEYQIEISEEDERQEESAIKKVLKWFSKNLLFLILPGSRLEDLTIRQMEYEILVSKRKFIRRLKSVLTIIGILIVLSIVTLAVFPHWIAPYTFEDASGVWLGVWDPPSPEHPLGQGAMGRDVLSRIIFGARASLTIALPAISFSVILGIMIGIIAAYYGGWLDAVIMRLCDILLAFPSLVLALVFIAIWGQQIQYIMLAWGILGVPYYARLIRGNVLQARALPYIDAAKVAGAGSWRIMFRHIFPNVIQPIIISFTFDIGGVILGLAGLAYLGFSDATLIEWGNDINAARVYLYSAPWASLTPGFMILVTVLGFMLVGDGLRDALDPRLRNL